MLINAQMKEISAINKCCLNNGFIGSSTEYSILSSKKGIWSSFNWI